MKNIKRILAALTVLLALSAFSARSQSLNLSGGSVVQLLTNQELVGNSPYPGNFGVNNGSISTWVVSDSALDSSGYMFIYQFINNGPDAMTGVEFNKFIGSQVVGTGCFSNIIGSLSLAGSINPPPNVSGRFTFDTVTAGGAATFGLGNFPSGSAPSWFLVIDTDVTSINTGFATTEDDFVAQGNILSANFAPVPEPSSSVLILGGLALLYCLFRFRRAAN